ncbi:MAG: hypothetical protein LBT36_01935, partial [Oscillospiraceae bacterium]|nr:hypothetical protein [Oscillospiraceae bacterium]
MADKLIFGSEDTEYGIVAHTPSKYAFHVTELGGKGEIYGLLCPEHGVEHLIPCKLRRSEMHSGKNAVIFKS